MKSLGVRLAAGAVTVLLGAFAAVQAQKDRQSPGSETWSAVTTTTSEQTPEPIGVAPATSLLSATEELDASLPGSGIRLVQHTQPANDENSTGDADSLSFVMPPADGQPSDPQTTAASNTLSADAAPSLTPNWAMPDNGTAETEPTALAAGVSGNGDSTSRLEASDFGSPQETDADATETMPEFQFADAPSFGSSPTDSAANLGSPVTTESPATEAPAASANPAVPNALRSGPAGGNALRGSAAVDPSLESTNGLGTAVIADQDFGSGPSIVAQQVNPSNPAVPAEFGTPSDFGTPADFGSPAEFGTSPDRFSGAAGTMAGRSAAGLGQPQAGLGQPQVSAAGTPPSFATPPGTPTFDPSVSTNEQNFGSPNPVAGFANPSVAAPAQLGGAYGNRPAERIASLPDSTGSLAGGFGAAAIQSASADPPNRSDATLPSPGDRRLEGAQAPSIVIQKRAPAEVKVGKPAAFVIHVQNVGSVEALDVTVHDQIPLGMRLIDASPMPVMQGEQLAWQLGTMQAGDERTVTMQLVPEQEGELGSVARVTFEAAASVRTISTRPALKIVQQVPAEKVLIGQQLEIDLEVSNPGTGAATGVILQEDVPEGLEHPKGRQLDNLIGDLEPGEVRRQVLRLRAVAPGVIQNTIRLVADDGLTTEHSVQVEVVAPELKVELSGPSKRFLERQATYNLEIANVGTASANNVEIAVALDRGFTFVSTENQGQYDPSRHAVFWSLAQLPAGGSGSVPLTLLPVEEGQQAINVEARADLSSVAQSERTIDVESFAELNFRISNPGGPIEIGSETVYEVTLQNTGSRNDTNVQVQLQLPAGLELVSTDGDARTNGQGLVAFQPQSELASGGEFTYRLRVRGVSPGTHLVRAVVTSDQSSVPVTKEESTRVYADQ